MENPFKTIVDRLDRIESKYDLILKHVTKEEQELERLLDKKEAANILGVSVSTIDNLRRDGFLTPTRFGKAVRFKLSDLYELADKRKAS